MNQPAKTRVTLFGRLAFPVLDKPQQFKGQGEFRYSANLILEDEAQVAKAKEAMRAAANVKWGVDGGKTLGILAKQAKICMIDGDTKPDYSGYPGNQIIAANAPQSQAPKLVATEGGRNVELDRLTQSKIYGGCYVNMIVDFWGQDNQYGKRLNAQVCGVQYVRHGDPFGGGRPADVDEFETIEGEDDLPSFDDGGQSDDEPDF